MKAFTNDPDGTFQFADTISGSSTFYVRTNNDIEVSDILQPANKSSHSILNPIGTQIDIPVMNSGFNDINEFWAQIYLHKIDYDPITGRVTPIPLSDTDTLPHSGASALYYHFNAANSLGGALKSGQTLMLTHDNFSGGFSNLEIGWYSLEVKV